ncbi:MAG: PilZ domain-containing protein [Rhizobiaceae bacterium]
MQLYKSDFEASTLAETIQGYLVAKANLLNFIDSLSDISDKSELKNLHALERQLEDAFEQVLGQDNDNLTASLDKLKFLIDQMKGEAEISELHSTAISKTLADLTKLTEAFADLPVNDRRQHSRTNLNKTATFISDSAESCQCTVENISFQGLCLTVEDERVLSETFRLDGIFEGGIVDAKEVWRNGRTVGARIVACVPG